ncbi:MAG: hypothetical protein AAF639_37540 [Chloroflexota bacterium]
MNKAYTMTVTSVEAISIQPEQADMKKITYLREHMKRNMDDAYTIVKLFLDEPLPMGAESPRLYVGDEEIMKYGGFAGGIYFKVYDPQFFEQHGGDAIYSSTDGYTLVDTGQTLPPAPSSSAPDNVAAAVLTKILPTKREMLGQ